jgi:hypothetical protein
MELTLIRTDFTETSTIGELLINNEFQCYTLEDTDRGLNSEVLDSLKSKKWGITAIPYGRYEIKMSWSNHFQKNMPHLQNVPDYSDVMIHWGNKPADTDGCVLVGDTKSANFIAGSRDAFSKLLPNIIEALKTEQVFLEIVNKNQVA